MNHIFFNDEGQVRSGWRATIFLLTFVLLSAFFIFVSLTALALLPIGLSAESYLPLVVPFVISALTALFLGWLYGKLFERLPWTALGLSRHDKWLRNLGAGCAVGALTFLVALIAAIVSGGITLTVNHESTSSAIAMSLLSTLLIFAGGALSEETLFRGYPLQTFVRSNLIPMGVGVTSVLFAFAHNSNPDVSKLALLNTFLAGIWFAVAYLKTRDLWFPLGMHLMWNWLQGPVFGINVSGISDLNLDPVLRSMDIGPAWLTGGTYGIEGGGACTIAILISTVAIYFLPISATEHTENTEIRR